MVKSVTIWIVLVAVLTVCSSEADKRVLLHSDEDISLELNNIKALLASQNQSIQALTAQVSSKDADIAQLRSQMTQLKSGGSSSYIRWGKTTCPGNGSTLVYSGYMAGADYRKSGTGANYLCLADKPRSDYVDSAHGYGGVRGIEYQFDSHTAAQIAAIFGSNIQNDDAPCAVCEISRATHIMIPGTNTCSSGWTKEYAGYIVSSAPGHAHTAEFVCLDRRPDVIPGSQVNDDHGLLYIAEIDCGTSSLCPPYAQGYELTCVICSK